MNRTDRAKRDGFKADLGKGLKQGYLMIRAGQVVMNRKLSPMTEEDRIQYKILSLKLKAHQQMAHLGERVYILMDFRGTNPGNDSSVKDITARLRRYETEIRSMERQLKSMRKKLETTP